MVIYALIYGGSENVILTMSTNEQDCHKERSAIKRRCGDSWREDYYWIEEIKITEGIFWEA